MSLSYIARQPIFDDALSVLGYELLYRPDEESLGSGITETSSSFTTDNATASVLLSAFTDPTFASLLADKPVFINFTPFFMDKALYNVLDKHKFVLEVNSDSLNSPEQIQQLCNLSAQGYRISLDDFSINNETALLLKRADYIKVDMLNNIDTGLLNEIKVHKGKDTLLIAKRIENYPRLEISKQLGFDYFQGYFLETPHLSNGIAIPGSINSVMTLLDQLNQPNITIEKIEKTLVTDPALSYSLLRIINAANFGLSREIKSIKEAVVMLGLKKLRSWSSILALTKMSHKPVELMQQTLTRARMCELLGEQSGVVEVDECFTAGLLSNLDAFIDLDEKQILSMLPISESIKVAILHFEGTVGSVYKYVLNYERNIIDAATQALNMMNIYLDSQKWAYRLLAAVR